MNFVNLTNRFDELKVSPIPPWAHETIMHPAMRGVLTGMMNKAAGGNDKRKIVLRALTGKESSKLLDMGEWYALFRFCFPVEGEHFVMEMFGGWAARPELAEWCRIILAHEEVQVTP